MDKVGFYSKFSEKTCDKVLNLEANIIYLGVCYEAPDI
jgi:hypothetical protein